MTPDIQNILSILHDGLPIWVLCVGIILCILIDALWPKKMLTIIYTVGILSLLTSLWAAWTQWQFPELILSQDLLVMDTLTLFFMFVVIVIAIITLFNSLGYIKIHQNLTAEFCSLILCSVVGMIFLFASDHLIVNFIGLETMSLCVYVLVGSHKKNYKSNEAAIKYFIMGGVASAILLYGIALFFGAFGTMRISQLTNLLPASGLAYLPKIAIGMMMVGIFFKIAIVPFHFWAPDVYEGAPSPVTGFMATAVKSAAIGFAIRIFTELNVLGMEQIPRLLTIFVIATLVVGNLMALVQDNVKRMLAYSSISHAGFLLFGILVGFENGVYVPFSSRVILFYLVGYFAMTLGAFAVLSLMTKEKSEATDYSDMRGLGLKHPILAGIFTLFMLSLIGMPGTIGFAAKFNLISLAIKNHHIYMAILAVLISVISVYYYLKPSVLMFFDKSDKPSVIKEIPLTLTVSLTFCAFLVVYYGIYPDTILKLSEIAASKFK